MSGTFSPSYDPKDLYYVSPIGKVASFLDAVGSCYHLGMEAASILNYQEEQELQRILEKSEIHDLETDLWIGATSIESKNETEFSWFPSGQKMAYGILAKRSPNRPIKKNKCIKIDYKPKRSSWETEECSKKFRFVCRQINDNDKKYSSRLLYNADKAYISAENDKVNFYGAVSKCYQKKMVLMTITDEEENTKLIKQIQALQTSHGNLPVDFWIGGTKKISPVKGYYPDLETEEKGFVWYPRGKPLPFTFWAENPHQKHHCLKMYRKRLPEVSLPPEPVITRWGIWIKAAPFYAEHFEAVKELILDLDDGSLCVVQTKKSCFIPDIISSLEGIVETFPLNVHYR